MNPCKFAISTNFTKDPEGVETRHIASYLQERGARVWLLVKPQDEVPAELADMERLQEAQVSQMDLVIVLGGDGTILSSARRLHEYDVPLLGINLGHLGFLTGSEKEDCESVLDQVLEGRYREEERVMLRGRIVHTNGEEQYFSGLNDAVITRGAFSRMLSISVKINGRLMDYFQADGMIVATPTGSTGYNLSAGGPIVVPYARGILITPICPRSLTMRSIVVSETDEINFEVLPETMGQRTPELMLTVDGQQGYSIVPGDQVFIGVDPAGVRLIHMENTTFFDTLRKKMFKESM
ncbi:MAG TPA: NAD(+)/NADH kinase [Candidatus Faecimorpha stercoravium]|nr:NAD(+)/NADH kinase [Candidatus Faecimorpha stercoravium]